jgi:hypothetical protein
MTHPSMCRIPLMAPCTTMTVDGVQWMRSGSVLNAEYTLPKIRICVLAIPVYVLRFCKQGILRQISQPCSITPHDSALVGVLPKPSQGRRAGTQDRAASPLAHPFG